MQSVHFCHVASLVSVAKCANVIFCVRSSDKTSDVIGEVEGQGTSGYFGLMSLLIAMATQPAAAGREEGECRPESIR